MPKGEGDVSNVQTGRAEVDLVSVLREQLWHLSQEVLLQVVASQQHLPLVLATLQLVVLPLPPQQAGLLLCLHLLQTLLLTDQPLLFLPLRSRLVLVQLLVEEAKTLNIKPRRAT